MLVTVPVSVGELFDKISILDIKTKKIKRKEELKIIKYELAKLKKTIKIKNISNSEINKKYKELKKVNEKLWNIENNKRKCEKEKKFDKYFISLARKVYIYNDLRAKIKREINVISGSKISEIKSYKQY